VTGSVVGLLRTAHDDLGPPVTEKPDGAATQTWTYQQRGNGLTMGVSDETGAKGALPTEACASTRRRLGRVGKPSRAARGQGEQEKVERSVSLVVQKGEKRRPVRSLANLEGRHLAPRRMAPCAIVTFISAITLELPEELTERLRSLADRLPQILELGLRELDASSLPMFAGVSDVLELLATLPTPEEVLALQPSPSLEARVRELLEKNRAGGLLPAEEEEWRRYAYAEHLVRLAKARAAEKLKQG
jgi:predicted transcriptional regulator